MECSICLKEIEKSVSTLSCGHHFHLGCIGRWVIKNESCPLCRHEMNEDEKIAEDQGHDDEEEEYDYSDDEEDDDEESVATEEVLNWSRVNGRWTVVPEGDKLYIPEYDPQSHALWVMRSTFERLETGEPFEAKEEKVEPRAIRKWRQKRNIVSLPDGRVRIEIRASPVYETLRDVYERRNKLEARLNCDGYESM